MPPKIQRWKNAPGMFSVELYLCKGVILEAATDKPAPMALQSPIFDGCELVFEFHSSGADDPGWLHGAPEDCWPAAYEEERTPNLTYIYKDEAKLPIAGELEWELFEQYRDKIEAEDLDPPPEYDPPERDL